MLERTVRNLIEWAKQNIFTTEGRLNRLKYFQYTLLVSLTFGIIDVVSVGVLSIITGLHDGILLNAINFITMLFMFLGNVMVSVRRCHDLNMSGGFVLLRIIPVVNFVFELYLLFAKGNVGWNKYGADPLLVNE